MSLFLQPKLDNPTDFRTVLGIEPYEIQDFFLRFDTQVQQHIDSIAGNQQHGHSAQTFVRFDLPAISVEDDELLQESESKIAEQLSISRVPRASGTRAVYVDLKRGVLLVGTTVLFNVRNVTHGVQDDSLIHKVDLIQTLLGLNQAVQEQAEEEEEEEEDKIDALSTVTLKIGGRVLTLREIHRLVQDSNGHSHFHHSDDLSP